MGNIILTILKCVFYFTLGYVSTWAVWLFIEWIRNRNRRK